MPPVIAAVVVAAAAYGAGVITLTTAIGLVASSVLSYAAQMLQKKPKAPSTDFSRDRTASFRQPIAPWQVIYGESRVGGAFTYIKSTDNNQYINLLITLAGHAIDSVQKVYFDDEEVTFTPAGSGRFTVTGKYAGWAELWFGYGDDGVEEQALLADLVTHSGGEWTSAHKQSGRAKLCARLRFNLDVYPNGVPTISAVVRGKKVYDPRDDTTAWSANAALCNADYVHDSSYGLGAAYDPEIGEDDLIEAANVCDEDVTLASGATEPRYTCNGSFETDQKPSDLIASLLSSMVGKWVLTGGVWHCYAGAYRTPTETIDETEARGGITANTRVSRRENFNAVKGLYIAPEQHWQPTDFPAVTNATYLAQDNNERVWKDIQLSFTTSASMAQRIAKIILEQARQQITVTYPAKLSAYRLAPPDVVGITNARRGWSDKPFELSEGQLVITQGNGDDAPVLGYDLTLRETASSVFDWNSGEETTVDPAPDSDLPNPFLVAKPGAPLISEALYATRDGGGVKSKAVISFMASQDGFLRAYQVEYRVVGDTVWTVLPQVPASPAEILDIAPGSYDFRVKAINQMGVSSDYATVTNREILGFVDPPAAVTGLTIQTIGGLAVLSWDLHTDLDVRSGGKIRFRHSPDFDNATWETSTTIGQTVPGIATFTALPLKAGTYMVKAQNSVGELSVDATAISSKAASVLDFANIDSLTEDATFTGDKDNVIVDDGNLELDDPSLAGTYNFSGGIDLGAVTRCRISAHIAAAVINQADLIDDRPGNIDDWEDFDGNAGAAADAWVEVRETDEDPANSPVPWGEWKRLDAAEFVARAFEFRCQLRAEDPAYNILISELRISVDQVV